MTVWLLFFSCLPLLADAVTTPCANEIHLYYQPCMLTKTFFYPGIIYITLTVSYRWDWSELLSNRATFHFLKVFSFVYFSLPSWLLLIIQDVQTAPFLQCAKKINKLKICSVFPPHNSDRWIQTWVLCAVIIMWWKSDFQIGLDRPRF